MAGLTCSEHYDAAETRDPRERETSLFFRLPRVIEAALKAPGWRDQFGAIDAASVTSRAALATLPILRKSELPAMQKAGAAVRRPDASAGVGIRASLHLARPDL